MIKNRKKKYGTTTFAIDSAVLWNEYEITLTTGTQIVVSWDALLSKLFCTHSYVRNKRQTAPRSYFAVHH